MNVTAILKDAGLESSVTAVNDDARLKKEEVDRLVTEHCATKSSNGSVIAEM